MFEEQLWIGWSGVWWGLEELERSRWQREVVDGAVTRVLWGNCTIYLVHTYSLGNKEPSWHSGNDEGEGWWWWWWWCWMAGQWAGRIVTRAGMCPLKPVLYMEQCKLWCNLLQYPCNICVAFMQYLCIVSAISCAIFLQYVCFLSWCSFYFLISYGKEEPYFSEVYFPSALCSSSCVKFCPILWGLLQMESVLRPSCWSTLLDFRSSMIPFNNLSHCLARAKCIRCACGQRVRRRPLNTEQCIGQCGAGAAVSGHWSAGWDWEGRGGQLDSGQRTRHCFASLPSLAVQ